MTAGANLRIRTTRGAPVSLHRIVAISLAAALGTSEVSCAFMRGSSADDGVGLVTPPGISLQRVHENYGILTQQPTGDVVYADSQGKTLYTLKKSAASNCRVGACDYKPA